jgi:hypothetical protein
MNIKDLLKLDFKTLAVIVLIIIIILMRACDGTGVKPVDIIKVDGKKYELLKHTIDTVYIPRDTIVYKRGRDIYHEKPVYLKLPLSIDTIAVLNDYYSKKVYIDTLQLADSLGYIIVNDTVSQNTVLGRLWNAQVNKIQIRETVIVKELPKNQVYIGLSGGFDKVNVVNFIGPSLLLKTKSDKIYSIGVGYSASKTISIQGSIYWKIKLKK